MTTRTRVALIIALGLVTGGAFMRWPVASARQQAVSAPAATGQSATQLADGRWLMLGGDGAAGIAQSAVIADPATGTTRRLDASMTTPRAGHTATLLPDGTVLIVGGRGPLGQLAQSAELFDPQTGAFLPFAMDGGTPRAGHTATLLSDGRVLVTGGTAIGDRVTREIEIWDVQAQRVVSAGQLRHARSGQAATLLGDGTVLLTDGTDVDGGRVAQPEIVDPSSTRVADAVVPIDDGAPVHLMASTPADAELDVPVTTRVALRFSRPLRVETVNAATVTLTGTEGLVDAIIVPAEGGRLGFVSPRVSLRHESAYTLTMVGASDVWGRPLVAAPITFVTVREPRGTSEVADEESWVPDERSRRNGWRTERPASPWESLAPLLAAPGVTAISGRVLTLDGRPLAGVSLGVEGDVTVHSDRTGRFLLELKAGATARRVLQIDGSPASRPTRRYGFFEYGSTVAAAKTTVLPFTIWMPKLDTAHQVTIASPTTGEVVVTTPFIPGLELHLPAGTTITGEDGKPVTTIGITAIPVDRPPFPLAKNVDVPVYFTVQPGGAYVATAGAGPKGAWLVYPNYHHSPAGKRGQFFHYDPDVRDWYIYGMGTVTPNESQAMPDPKTRFYQFTGAMFNAGPSPPPAAPPPGDCCNKDGDPVSLSTGLFTLEATDLSLPDVLPIAVTRSYRPRDVEIRPFGVGTTHPYAMFLSSEQQYTEADLVLPDGAKIHYVRTSSGVGFTDAVFAHEERPNATPPTAATPTAFYKSVLIWNGNGWNLTLKNGTVYVFGENAPLVAIRDRSGNQITIAHANGQSGNITQVTSPHGRWIAFTYDTSNRITQIKDNIGRTVGYTYDGGGNLATVTDPENHVTSYTYDTSHQMLTVKPPNLQGTQTNLVTNEYTTAADAPTPVGWVKKQTHADGGVYLFAYTFVSGKISRTDVTNPGGFVRRVTFNGDGYSLGETRALGQPEQQVTNSVRQGGTQLVSSRANALGDQTTSTYDAKGNLTSVTQLAGTPDARTTSYTYEPTFNQIATVTDPLNHTWTMGYDALGRFTSVRDPLTHQITAVVNSAGLITSVTDPLQHTWQSVFVAADLVSTTDPLGRVRSRFVDAAGRVLATTDPRGRTTRLTVDKLNRTTMSTDALGGQTSFNYDANNNLLSLTDALAHVTTSTYDTSDRVATQMDPLLHTASYLYNSSSNLMQATDRTSQTTTAQYDALDRVTQVTYADNSTTQYVYDAGDRLTQIIDSVVGTITRSYDGLDRLTSESTSDGNVSYTYDADGRRATMTVAGQPTVTYAYDDAHRLTAITEGASAVTFTYDDAGRRTTLAQPNGVVTTYGYDAANQLTSLTYMQGPTTLGTLTYAYDAAGNRTSVGGAWARTGLPPALASASYDAGNRMTVWAGQAWSYDANGNLASDGLISYAWNARGQLAGLNGATTASFAYDAMGRRRARTTSGTTIYLYDGVNAAQELVGGSSTATTLTGGIDEAFQRTEGAAARAVLSDALGSTVALVDGSGTVQTQYTYDPFGATSTSGSASSNPAQYTGRENDGSGLYYYRARYYASNAARFISEDPAGFAGGINPYTYVKNNPVNFVDPMGLQGKSLAEDAFPHCNPSEKMKKCLKKILNEPVDSIDVVQDPLPSAGFAATVRPGVIFSFVPCAQFWQQPPLILEEYYHATKQITGWAGLLKYVALGLISGYDEHPWEREAQDFARKHKDELKKCLDCPQ